MMANLFTVEKKPIEKVSRSQLLASPQEPKLKSQNDRLKKQIDMLYHILAEKENLIFKLKKFILSELEKPEFDDDYILLEDQLNKIFESEDDYDPRPNLKKTYSDPTVEDNTLSVTMALEKSTSCQFDTRINQISDSNLERKQSVDISLSLGQDRVPNQEQVPLFEKEKLDESPSNTNLCRLESKDYEKRRKYSLIKTQDLKKVPIKPLSLELVTRQLFSFELELKEYSPSTFEAIKHFVAKTPSTAEKIHDEIERLAEIAAKQKYFHKIFPEDTVEKVADELENYMLEILYFKLFNLDEDAKGHNQQWNDRLKVLRGYVTFEMLEIPEEMRSPNLYTQAMKELEKLSQFKTPIWKLQAFQNCVNHVLNVFNETTKRTPCSDELFPVLVYVVLHAKIDELKYNVDYIHTYLRKCHLMGQLGFLVINMKAIIQFLQDLNGHSLSKGKLEMKKL